jgi:hypothetical protein
MRSFARTAITWFVIGLLALISSLGEALHLIPGCGHAVEFPGGYVLFGLDRPAPADYPDDSAPRFRQPGDNLPPCYDEDDCPICRLSGQGKQTTAGIDTCLVLPFAHGLPPIVVEASRAGVFRPFRARAPPFA